MSRYTLRHDDEYEVTVGYDDPLDTFFAQVLDIKASDREDDDVYVLLVGQQVRAIEDPEALLNLVAHWVPDDVRRNSVLLPLKSDQEMRRQPTEFQRTTFNRLTGDDLP